MVSCGLRSVWRALMCRKSAAIATNAFDYDKLLMPLLCVCGTAVYVGAGIVLRNQGVSQRLRRHSYLALPISRSSACCDRVVPDSCNLPQAIACSMWPECAVTLRRACSFSTVSCTTCSRTWSGKLPRLWRAGTPSSSRTRALASSTTTPSSAPRRLARRAARDEARVLAMVVRTHGRQTRVARWPHVAGHPTTCRTKCASQCTPPMSCSSDNGSAAWQPCSECRKERLRCTSTAAAASLGCSRYEADARHLRRAACSCAAPGQVYR